MESINSAQLVVFAPLFQNLKFPNNASAMNKELISVADFDIINTPEWIDPYVIDLGDDGEPFSYNFEQCGFETTWFFANSSVKIWMYLVNFALFVIYLLVNECSKRTGMMKPLRSRLHGYFVYNGPLRLFMETFLDLYLSSLLNVMTAEKETDNGAV